MGLGVGIFLIAVGAVLAFAVHTTAAGSGVDLHTIGLILMAVGAFGILLSMLFWSSWGGPGYLGRSRRTYVDGPGMSRETRVDEF
jgi:hypothetical protein